jgi:hypothetical protein
MKRGENLQQLVAAIERATHRASNVRVDSPKYLPDKDTGRPREHDVLLTFTLDHHRVLLAIECRDRSRATGVPEVEAFSKKCERTGVNKGVIVSARGFRKSALKKAAQMEIACLTLEQVSGFDWCLTPVVKYHERDLIDDERPWGVATAEPFNGPLHLYDASGAIIDAKRKSELAHTYLAMRPPQLAIPQDKEAIHGSVTCTFQNDMPDLYLRNNQGDLVRITRLIAYVTYKVRTKLVPLDFRGYVDLAMGKIASVAVAQIDGTTGTADFVIRRAPDGTTTMVLVKRE